MSVDDKVLSKLKKLMNMTTERGCTPAEAAAAAAHVERILEEHQLSRFDVDSKKFDEEVVDEKAGVKLGKVVPAWSYALASAVATPHEVVAIFSWTPHGEHVLRFVGHKSDASVSSYLYVTLFPRLLRMADVECVRLGRFGAGIKTFKRDFMLAAAQTIYVRLKEERDRVRAQNVASRDLVVVKKDAVEDYMKRRYPGAKTSRVKTDVKDLQAHARGLKAGDSIELRRGVEGSSGPGPAKLT